MSKYHYAILVASLFSLTGAMADEVTQSTSTKVDAPDYSASQSSTRTETNPTATTRETTTKSETPYSQEVSTKKEYKTAPCRNSSSTTTRETTINR